MLTRGRSLHSMLLSVCNSFQEYDYVFSYRCSRSESPHDEAQLHSMLFPWQFCLPRCSIAFLTAVQNLNDLITQHSCILEEGTLTAVSKCMFHDLLTNVSDASSKYNSIKSKDGILNLTDTIAMRLRRSCHLLGEDSDTPVNAASISGNVDDVQTLHPCACLKAFDLWQVAENGWTFKYQTHFFKVSDLTNIFEHLENGHALSQ